MAWYVARYQDEYLDISKVPLLVSGYCFIRLLAWILYLVSSQPVLVMTPVSTFFLYIQCSLCLQPTVPSRVASLSIFVTSRPLFKILSLVVFIDTNSMRTNSEIHYLWWLKINDWNRLWKKYFVHRWTWEDSNKRELEYLIDSYTKRSMHACSCLSRLCFAHTIQNYFLTFFWGATQC